MDIRFVYPEKGAAMHTTLFLSNRTQAVRLPKSISFPEDVKHVEIIAVGRSRVITPVGESWDSWFDGEGASTDFMSTREQPAEQEREGF
jgi:Virulence-associated protein and related proteins